jgi:hypothetical protein
VLAADQRVTAWAEELRKAGLEGSIDQLRARAYMDILLGVDSRPRANPARTTQTRTALTALTGLAGPVTCSVLRIRPGRWPG